MSNLRRRLKKVEEKLNIDINKSKHSGAFTRACARGQSNARLVFHPYKKGMIASRLFFVFLSTNISYKTAENL